MIKIDEKLTEPLIKKAANIARKRTNHNFHKEDGDTLHRMLNIMNINTYVQPHKHDNPDKREAFIILKGKGLVIEFDDDGNITDYIHLDPQKLSHGCEIAAKTWHTVICLEDNTVFYEVKDGPYHPLNDKDFAAWAPKEGDKKCLGYIEQLLKQIGIES